jgi:hypothetical protein
MPRKQKYTSRRASQKWIEEYKYRNGGCCLGKRAQCDTLVAFDHNFIISCRSAVANQNKLVRQQQFISLTKAAKNKETGRLQHFNVGDVRLCKTAFCQLHNVSISTLRFWAESDVVVDNGYTPRDCTISGQARSWLNRRLPDFADTSPKSQNLILPQETINSKELRRMYIYESHLVEGGQYYISKGTWYRLMKVLSMG